MRVNVSNSLILVANVHLHFFLSLATFTYMYIQCAKLILSKFNGSVKFFVYQLIFWCWHSRCQRIVCKLKLTDFFCMNFFSNFFYWFIINHIENSRDNLSPHLCKHWPQRIENKLYFMRTMKLLTFANFEWFFSLFSCSCVQFIKYIYFHLRNSLFSSTIFSSVLLE